MKTTSLGLLASALIFSAAQSFAAAPALPAGAVKGEILSFTPEKIVEMNRNRLKSPLRVAGNSTVAVNLAYATSYKPKEVYVYNENAFLGGSFNRLTVNDDQDQVTFSNVAPGKYTAMASFDDKNNEDERHYVFLEEFTVSADTTAITLDVATSTHHFYGATILPNGQVAKTDGYDADWNYTFGNCKDRVVATNIYDTKQDAWIGNIMGRTGNFSMPGYDIDRSFNVWVNDLSDRFVVIQQRTAITPEGLYSTVACSKGSSNLNLVNDTANYTTHTEKFLHTPLADEYAPRPTDGSYQLFGLSFNGWPYFFFDNLKWYYTGPLTTHFSTQANFYTDFADHVHPYYRMGFTDCLFNNTEFKSEGQRFAFDSEGTPYYMFSNFYPPIQASWVVARDNDDNDVYYAWPGNDGLKVTEAQAADYAINSCAPFNSMMPYIDHNPWTILLKPTFRGQLCESTESYELASDIAVYRDGAPVSSSLTWNGYWANVAKTAAAGRHSFDIKNNSTTIKVDSLPGHSNMHMEFTFDGNDWCAPTLQAFQVRNKAGKLTNKFDAPEDVAINICAGDYDWNINDDFDTYNYYSKPLNVKVEIADYPAGDSSTWTELNLNVNPDYSHQGGYGFFYNATLPADVTFNKGWKTARITLTDSVGNVNRQELEPVFYLATTTTGLDCIRLESKAERIIFNGTIAALASGKEARMEVITIDGRTALAAYGSEINLSTLPTGCYIIKAGATTAKIIKR